MKLLRYFRGFDANIVEILDIMVSPNQRDFLDVYIVTNLMETNLRSVIVSGQPLEDTHFKYFTYQILRALRLVHSANVRTTVTCARRRGFGGAGERCGSDRRHACRCRRCCRLCMCVAGAGVCSAL
jgi:hypothetical protein